MYARKAKKPLPPGTFIARPARIAVVLQLCLAFTLLAWNACQPFMGELFSIRSRMLLYQDVMGIRDQAGISVDLERLERNAQRFSKLSEKQKTPIIEGYKHLQEAAERSFWSKCVRSLQLLALGIPPFEQAWIVFSIAISILLLKKVEGAVSAVWILPLLAILYAADNRWNGIARAEDEETILFPTEAVLVEKYLKQPLSQNIFQQREQLMHGWKMYLIQEWAYETTVSEKSEAFDQQAEKGEFSFNVARLEILSPLKSLYSFYYSNLWFKQNLLILSSYIFWNMLVCFIVIRNCKSICKQVIL